VQEIELKRTGFLVANANCDIAVSLFGQVWLLIVGPMNGDSRFSILARSVTHRNVSDISYFIHLILK